MSSPTTVGVVTTTSSLSESRPEPPAPLSDNNFIAGSSRVDSHAARLAGFGEPPNIVRTREELMEQGLSGPQADARLVRAHEEEVLMQNFRKWILGFTCLLCILTPAMVGVLMWMIVEFWEYRLEKCDVPLLDWAKVVFLAVVFNATVNRPSPSGSLIVKLICCWRRDPDDPQPVPLRVRLYNLSITLFIFVWNCLGLHWIRTTGDDPDASLPSCRAVMPGFVQAAQVYAALNIAFTTFMYVSMMGFAHVLRSAMRNGYLHTSNAAPKGALERNTDVVEAGDPLLEDNPTCSICLEEFVGNSGKPKEVLKTRVCSHMFHTPCIQGWMRVNRTCPLCRMDLDPTMP